MSPDGAGEETTGPPGLDLEAFRRWWAHHVDLDHDATLRLIPCEGSGASSNWIATDGEREWIVRQRSGAHRYFEHLLDLINGSAQDEESGRSLPHDLLYEYRVLRMLQGGRVPVPSAIAYCSDPSVSPSPFFVMEKCEGLIARSSAELQDLTPDECRRASEQIIDHLARLHSFEVPTPASRSIDVAPPTEDKVRSMLGWWESRRARALPGVEEAFRRLLRALPSTGTPALTHGDYRIDNIVLDRQDRGRIVALLDWERARLDDPLIDLGTLLTFWSLDEPALEFISPAIGAHRGFLSAESMAERYAQRTGTDRSRIDYFSVLGALRLFLIVELVLLPPARHHLSRDRAEELSGATERIVEQALQTARASSLRALR